ncbi:MAG: LamG domain-containing protein [Candidatus Poribacteria bacterium]|nr:LamG domain-containing protein [Candidatus Poribacteria bacterium]
MGAATFASAQADPDLVFYYDFEQSPGRYQNYLAYEPINATTGGFTFDPLELRQLERALSGANGGFSFDPLELTQLERSLIGKYTGVALDRSGANRNAGVFGTVALTNGIHMRSVRFERNGTLYVPSTVYPNATPTTAMSVLGWVKIDEPGEVGAALGFMPIDLGGGQIGFAFNPLNAGGNVAGNDPPVELFPYITSDNALNWSLHTGNGTPIFTLKVDFHPTDGWTHLAGTYDSAEGVARFYINGAVVASANGAGRLMSYLGEYGTVTLNSPSYAAVWSMDDLNVWKRALTGDEVRHVMEFGPLPAADPVTDVEPLSKTAATWGKLKAR